MLEDVVNGTISVEDAKARIRAISKIAGGATAIMVNKDISQKELDQITKTSESVTENNSLKLLVTAVKIGSKIKKLYDKGKKPTLKDLKKILDSEALDMADDVMTIMAILDGNASPTEVALAVADLVAGTDFNSAKTRAITRAKKARDKAKAKPIAKNKDKGEGILNDAPDGYTTDPITGENVKIKPGDVIHADHILPQKVIENIEGFDLLTPKEKKLILGNSENLQKLLRSVNCSKSNCTVTQFKGSSKRPFDKVLGKTIDPVYKAAIDQKQKDMFYKMTKWIEEVTKGR